MRITCPNCAAQYTVEEAAIPASGRELICSACGHMWFHAPSVEGTDPAASASGSGVAHGEAPWEDDGHDAPTAPVVPPPLDPALRAVLRAEAAREAKARQAEAGASARAGATETGAASGGAHAPESAPEGAQPDPVTPKPQPDSQVEARPRGSAVFPTVEDIAPSAPGPRTVSSRRAAVAAVSVHPESDAPSPRPEPSAPARRRGALWLAAVLGVALAAGGLHVHTRSAEAPPAAMLAYADWIDRRQEDLGRGLSQAWQWLQAALRGGA